MLKTFRDWLERQVNVKRDNATGLYRQEAFGGKVFLRSPYDYQPQRKLDWLCRDVYFKEYLPRPGDTVVDIGAGYGHEAVYLASRVNGVHYVGVEVQPSVFECLANTFGPYRPLYRACPLAIADASAMHLHTLADYEDAAAVEGDGPVEVATISWNDFLRRYDIAKIDLLKVNIEGAERYLLDCISGYEEIARILISAHDFRADRGEGEHFRTRSFVLEKLQSSGFEAKCLNDSPWWRDWIFAVRRTDERTR